MSDIGGLDANDPSPVVIKCTNGRCKGEYCAMCYLRMDNACALCQMALVKNARTLMLGADVNVDDGSSLERDSSELESSNSEEALDGYGEEEEEEEHEEVEEAVRQMNDVDHKSDGGSIRSNRKEDNESDSSLDERNLSTHSLVDDFKVGAHAKLHPKSLIYSK